MTSTTKAPRAAAGVLLRHTDEDGQVWFLVAQRAEWMRNGGTWANVGGFLDRGELALTGALREFTEEMGLPAQALKGARSRTRCSTTTTRSATRPTCSTSPTPSTTASCPTRSSRRGG